MNIKENTTSFSSNLLTIASIMITIIISIKLAFYDEVAMGATYQIPLSICPVLLFVVLLLSLINTFLISHFFDLNKEKIKTAIMVIDIISFIIFLISCAIIVVIIALM